MAEGGAEPRGPDASGPAFATDAERALGRQLATLVHSRVSSQARGGTTSAVAWWNGLARLGLTPPLFVVHDVGLLLSGRATPGPGATERERGAPSALSRYQGLLATIAGSEAVKTLSATFVRDEVMAVLLGRLLGDATRRWQARPGIEVPRQGPLAVESTLHEQDPAALARLFDTAWAQSYLQPLVDQELALRARLDQLDLGPLRLLGLFPQAGGTLDLVELQQIFGRAGVSDVADFCLQLLPSLLETKRHAGAQRFSVDGYASVERRGSPEALLPSEIAHDEEMFAQRALSQELLYYGHERPQEGARREHGILVDVSASMRGAREVFGRGLALALAKKLSLLGTEVWIQFFDSRLHRRVRAETSAGQDLPYLLCFRSERGRNYARVFQDLANEIERTALRRKRELFLTIITHAECHIPHATVEALARRAALHGVFVLPSQPLALDYLPLLRRYRVVTAQSLAEPTQKRQRALEIVGDMVAATAPASDKPPA